MIIKDPVGFFTALRNEGVELNSKRPLHESFEGARVCKVEYNIRRPKFERDGWVPANPCQKRKEYVDQAEERLILRPRSDLGIGFFHVLCPAASKFMQIIDIPNPATVSKFVDAMEPYKELSLAQCDEQLDVLWQEYRSLATDQGETKGTRSEIERTFDKKNRAQIIRLLYRRRHHDSIPSVDKKIINGVHLYFILSGWNDARVRSK